MPTLRIAFMGPPGEVVQEIVHLLPDSSGWLVSDPSRPVIIARDDTDRVRELIFAAPEEPDPPDGPWELEVLASAGVDELVLQALVGVALAAGLLALGAMWIWGPGGWMGLALGVGFGGSLPAVVMAIGQRWVDPGRDLATETQLERAVRFAIAQCDRASIVSPDDSDR